MEEAIILNKQQYLDEYYPFEDAPKLTAQKRCMHCDSNIKVGDYKVFRNEERYEFICCPNAPECNGTVIDWINI